MGRACFQQFMVLIICRQHPIAFTLSPLCDFCRSSHSFFGFEKKMVFLNHFDVIITFFFIISLFYLDVFNIRRRYRNFGVTDTTTRLLSARMRNCSVFSAIKIRHYLRTNVCIYRFFYSHSHPGQLHFSS